MDISIYRNLSPQQKEDFVKEYPELASKLAQEDQKQLEQEFLSGLSPRGLNGAAQKDIPYAPSQMLVENFHNFLKQTKLGLSGGYSSPTEIFPALEQDNSENETHENPYGTPAEQAARQIIEREGGEKQQQILPQVWSTPQIDNAPKANNNTSLLESITDPILRRGEASRREGRDDRMRSAAMTRAILGTSGRAEQVNGIIINNWISDFTKANGRKPTRDEIFNRFGNMGLSSEQLKNSVRQGEGGKVQDLAKMYLDSRAAGEEDDLGALTAEMTKLGITPDEYNLDLLTMLSAVSGRQDFDLKDRNAEKQDKRTLENNSTLANLAHDNQQKTNQADFDRGQSKKIGYGDQIRTGNYTYAKGTYDDKNGRPTESGGAGLKDGTIDFTTAVNKYYKGDKKEVEKWNDIITDARSADPELNEIWKSLTTKLNEIEKEKEKGDFVTSEYKNFINFLLKKSVWWKENEEYYKDDKKTKALNMLGQEFGQE